MKKNALVRSNKVGTNVGPIEFSRGNTSSDPIRRFMAAAVFPATTWKPPYAFPYLLFFFIYLGIFSFSTLPTSYASNPLLPLFHPFFRLHSLSSQVLTPSRSCFISFFLPVSDLFCLHGIRPPTDIKLHKERETPSGDCSRSNKYFQIVTRVSRHGCTAGHIIKIYTGAIWGLSSATGKNTTSPNTRRLILFPSFSFAFSFFSCCWGSQSFATNRYENCCFLYLCSWW